jgi:hypothetical protein
MQIAWVECCIHDTLDIFFFDIFLLSVFFLSIQFIYIVVFTRKWSLNDILVIQNGTTRQTVNFSKWNNDTFTNLWKIDVNDILKPFSLNVSLKNVRKMRFFSKYMIKDHRLQSILFTFFHYRLQIYVFCAVAIKSDHRTLH